MLTVINKVLFRPGRRRTASRLARIKIDFVFMKCRGYFGTRLAAYGGFPPSENRRDLIVSHSRCTIQDRTINLKNVWQNTAFLFRNLFVESNIRMKYLIKIILKYKYLSKDKRIEKNLLEHVEINFQTKNILSSR